MAEIVDVVNPDDEVIRQAARERCHRENLIHRGVAILVFRREDTEELLLQRRSSNVAIKPGYIGLTGGHVQQGESYVEAARREFSEELYHSSSKTSEMEELFKLKMTGDDEHKFVKVFRAFDSGPFDLLDEEVSEVFFESFDAIFEDLKDDATDFTDTARIILEEYDDRFRD